jgi:hypothetical protein
MKGEDSQDRGPEVKHDLTEIDKHYLSSVSSSISRARNLLLACSFIGAWVLANVVLELLLWQTIRNPASQNIIHAADAVLQDVEILVPVKNLRPCDEVDYLAGCRIQASEGGKRVRHRWVTVLPYDSSGARPQGADSTEPVALVHYPAGELFEEKVDWCRSYREFAMIQSRSSPTGARTDFFASAFFDTAMTPTRPDSSVVRAIGVVLDRGDISGSKLPKDIIDRPQASVPVVGLDMSRDDIPIVGAILLILGMIWFRFALDAVGENIREVKGHFSGDHGRIGFLKSFLSLQFMFIRKSRDNSGNRAVLNTHFFVYCLFFVPYMVILFTFATDLYDIAWQVAAYSYVCESQFTVPFEVGSGFLLKDETGILTIRWAVLLGAAILLARMAWRSWDTMHRIREDLDCPEGAKDLGDQAQTIGARLPRRSAFLLITVVPVFVMVVWTLARVIGVRSSIETYGWSYGLHFWGALAVAGSVFASVALVQWVWPEMQATRTGRDTKAG